MNQAIFSRRSFVGLLGTTSAGMRAAFAQPGGCAGQSGIRDAQLAVDDVFKTGMGDFKIPSAGYAIVDCGRVAAARSFGVLRAGTNKPADNGTLYQAASISKTVAAVTALRLVQDGKLNLDAAVGPRLKSWHIPPGPQGPAHLVTLRRLLGMTAGVNVHGFAGYEAGARIPSLVEILEGAKPIVNSDPIRVIKTPGEQNMYSGGGYQIAELLMQDMTGEKYADLVQKHVFDPLAMHDSNLSQPLAAQYEGRTSEGHNSAGVPIAGRWHAYPEHAAAGVWTTPSDLARLAAAISNGYQKGEFLNHRIATEMMTPVDGFGYGIGGALEGSGRSLVFMKGGDNAGYHCFMMIFPETGQGMAIMTNADNGPKLFVPAFKAASSALHWPPYKGLSG